MTDVLTAKIQERQRELDAMEPEYAAAKLSLDSAKDAFCARAAELIGTAVPSPEAAMILLGRLAEAAQPIIVPGQTIAAYLSLKSTIQRLKESAIKS